MVYVFYMTKLLTTTVHTYCVHIVYSVQWYIPSARRPVPLSAKFWGVNRQYGCRHSLCALCTRCTGTSSTAALEQHPEVHPISCPSSHRPSSSRLSFSLSFLFLCFSFSPFFSPISVRLLPCPHDCCCSHHCVQCGPARHKPASAVVCCCREPYVHRSSFPTPIAHRLLLHSVFFFGLSGGEVLAVR